MNSGIFTLTMNKIFVWASKLWGKWLWVWHGFSNHLALIACFIYYEKWVQRLKCPFKTCLPYLRNLNWRSSAGRLSISWEYPIKTRLPDDQIGNLGIPRQRVGRLELHLLVRRASMWRAGTMCAAMACRMYSHMVTVGAPFAAAESNWSTITVESSTLGNPMPTWWTHVATSTPHTSGGSFCSMAAFVTSTTAIHACIPTFSSSITMGN